MPNKINQRVEDENIQKICDEVEEEYEMGGLSTGLYGSYAIDVAKRYALQARQDLYEELKAMGVFELSKKDQVLEKDKTYDPESLGRAISDAGVRSGHNTATRTIEEKIKGLIK